MVILTELSEGSSSSSSTSDHKYDVFLSFRGVDTRQNFTDHLHKALLDANIDTFLADEEIDTGEELKPELESAIKASRASILVLSKNYATSTWCLDELVLILERRKTCGHIVIPIFYHVEPTDVRKQQRSFADGLTKHKQRMEEEKNVEKKSQWAQKLELWKKALTEVADLKGEDARGRRETEFIKEIVEKISNTLCLHLRRELPHLIGMENSIKAITSWLKDGSVHNADILTIWGMAGIGKTSLAKYVHQLNYLSFERSSFLEDIGRKCTEQSCRIIDFQKQLLEDISNKSSIKVRDVDACTYKIEKALLRKKVLLVLDDVDSSKQLDVLIGKKGFHRGSKIMITTKDRSLIEKGALCSMKVQPKHKNHVLEPLREADSLRLLSWHAFRCDGPKEGFEEKSRKVVEYCGGHPLALEVLGSSLRNKDVDAWEDTLEDLQKEVHPDIQKVLQISFDSLPSEKDKKLFKYIACFFVGKDAEFTEKILKACDICKSSGIKNLIDRCFLTVGFTKELMMHQLLQDMGRDMVRLESPEKPRKRSLLWHHEESFNVLKSKKGTKKIQGLVLDMKKFENETSFGSSSASTHMFGNDLYDSFKSIPLLHRVLVLFSVIWWLFGWIFGLRSSFHHQEGVFETDTFTKMCNLRLLQLNYVQLNGSYKNFPKGLRWLCMHGFPLSCIPSDLQMENMVALDMSFSNLQQLWKKTKLLRSLKFLNLSCCDKLVRVGGFSRLPVLERLVLAGCASLIEVCESIGNCDQLLLLDLSECNKLKKLPRSIGKLKKVRFLSIDGCANLGELPLEMKDMESLKGLNANNISIRSQAFLSSFANAEVVPRSSKLFAISLPRSLVSLSLENNNLFNESFPMDFSSLSRLKFLNLGMNPFSCLPDCVRDLSRLDLLSLDGCRMLKSLSGLPSTLQFLDANNCTLLEKITFRPEMSRPPDVSFLSSMSLTEIEGIRKLQPITQVDEEILCSLGWSISEFVKHEQVQVFDALRWDKPKKLLVQMLYELGIFSTSFLGRKVPEWLSYHRSEGSSLSFTVPSFAKTLRGLNVGYVYTYSSIEEFGDWQDIIKNKTKKCSWTYEPYFHVLREADEESIVCLRHWMIGKNEVDLEEGDEVTIFIAQPETNGVTVSECGISLLYDEYDDRNKKEEDPLAYYNSWNPIIGINPSSFQTDDGRYYLMNRHYTTPPPVLFQQETTHQFLGNITPLEF